VLKAEKREGTWARRLSAWKTGVDLPATQEILVLAIEEIDPSRTFPWRALWLDARAQRDLLAEARLGGLPDDDIAQDDRQPASDISPPAEPQPGSTDRIQ
jgi:hypothetical protein